MTIDLMRQYETDISSWGTSVSLSLAKISGGTEWVILPGDITISLQPAMWMESAKGDASDHVLYQYFGDRYAHDGKIYAAFADAIWGSPYFEHVGEEQRSSTATATEVSLPSSTAFDPHQLWSHELPRQIEALAGAAEDDDTGRDDAAASLAESIRTAGKNAYYVLYPLLDGTTGISVAGTCLVLLTLSSYRTLLPRHRTRLVTQGLYNRSAAVRDEAALTLMRIGARGVREDLEHAYARETNRHAKASMRRALDFLR